MTIRQPRTLRILLFGTLGLLLLSLTTFAAINDPGGTGEEVCWECHQVTIPFPDGTSATQFICLDLSDGGYHECADFQSGSDLPCVLLFSCSFFTP